MGSANRPVNAMMRIANRSDRRDESHREPIQLPIVLTRKLVDKAGGPPSRAAARDDPVPLKGTFVAPWGTGDPLGFVRLRRQLQTTVLTLYQIGYRN
jgi:hypothetical protein